MNLLHPWALGIGALAISLPVLIHWLTRPRPVTLPLSTLRFVREAVQQRRARYRLRDLLVLLLRTAAVALLAWAFARPLVGTKPAVAETSGDAVRVVVVDRSQSMAALTGGVQAFERARPAAATHLTGSSGVRGNLILAGARPTPVFPTASSNFAAMQESLASAQVSSEQLDVRAVVEQAANLLNAAPPGARKELVIISDFQRSNWSAADFSPLPKETVILLESAAPAAAPANLAVLQVAAQGRVEQNRPTRIEVEVGNHSTTAREVTVDVSVGGTSLRLSGVCPPGARTTLSGECMLTRPGWQAGEARLSGAKDALPADDGRSFVLEVRPTPTYALITREAVTPQPTSSHFLERALAPVLPTENRPAEKVVRIDPSSLERDGIANADLLVLDHPGRLTPESMKLLASLLRRGRSILYIAAEPADATNLSLLAAAAAPDLKMPVQYAAPAAGQGRSGLFVTSFRRQDPLFAIFGDEAGAALSPLRFGGGLVTRPVEGGLTDDVVATFSDQSAALVVTSCGAGTLAVLNVSLLDSTLPASPVFVPLLGELTSRLMSRRRDADTAAPGERAITFLPPEAGLADGLTLTSAKPDAGALGGLKDEGGAVVWTWDSAGTPGVYTVRRGQQDVFALATAVPASESDLAALDAEILKTRLTGGRTVSYRQTGQDDDASRRDTRWAWIAAACAACMLMEVLVLKAFRT